MATAALTEQERERLVGLVDAGGVAFWRYLDITLEEVHDVGHVTLRMPMRADLETRRPGVMHGGALNLMWGAPALYAVWFRVRRDSAAPATAPVVAANPA